MLAPSTALSIFLHVETFIGPKFRIFTVGGNGADCPTAATPSQPDTADRGGMTAPRGRSPTSEGRKAADPPVTRTPRTRGRGTLSPPPLETLSENPPTRRPPGPQGGGHDPRSMAAALTPPAKQETGTSGAHTADGRGDCAAAARTQGSVPRTTPEQRFSFPCWHQKLNKSSMGQWLWAPGGVGAAPRRADLGVREDHRGGGW